MQKNKSPRKNFRGLSREQLLDILKNYYKKYGHSPTTKEFEKSIYFPSLSMFRNKFGSWGNALQEVGLIYYNPTHKGGRIITSNGYVAIYDKYHPNRQKNNYIAEHILIMEKQLGRYLKKGELIHHINEDRTDNRIDNLELMSRSRHKSIHGKKWHKENNIIKLRNNKGQFITNNS